MTQQKTRLKKYILESYGKETLDAILSGDKQIFLNEKLIKTDKKFSDNRVSPITKVVIKDVTRKPEKKFAIVETKVPFREKEVIADVKLKTPVEIDEPEEETEETEEELPSQELIDLHKNYVDNKSYSEQMREEITGPVEKETKKLKLKDFLRTEQVVAVKSGKAVVFVDGFSDANLDREIIADEEGKPVVEIKVTPKLSGG